MYASGHRSWPKSLPTSFIRPAWRNALLESAGRGATEHRHAWEAAVLLALRDRVRAGDIWVGGSRQSRAVEDQLISPAMFAAMREAGPLPVAVPETAAGLPGPAPRSAGTAPDGGERQGGSRRAGGHVMMPFAAEEPSRVPGCRFLRHENVGS